MSFRKCQNIVVIRDQQRRFRTGQISDVNAQTTILGGGEAFGVTNDEDWLSAFDDVEI